MADNRRGRRTIWLLALLLLLLLQACGSVWPIEIVGPNGASHTADAARYAALEEHQEEVSGRQMIPLERFLVDIGHRAVERIVVIGPEGQRRELGWSDNAGLLWIGEDGRLWREGETIPAATIEVHPPDLLAQVEADIIDIAPTTAAALGVAAPAQSSGQVLEAPQADHVLLLFLDALGYVRYNQAREAGLLPHLSALGEPLLALTTYPPCTSVSTASLLTGAPPAVHGAHRRGIRSTEVETLFDVVAAAGGTVVAVEGESLAFNLRNAEFDLSGDHDGNGSTDDNVLQNALAVLEDVMPELLFVHFHGIDDAGHTYGPGAPEEKARIREVDAAVGQILEALPEGVLVIVFADHGMHLQQDGDRAGNHGYLIERDIFIPIWIWAR